MQVPLFAVFVHRDESLGEMELGEAWRQTLTFGTLLV